MEKNEESMIEYVMRHIDQPYINIKGLAEVTNISRARLYGLLKDPEVATFNTIQVLHDFFKKISD